MSLSFSTKFIIMFSVYMERRIMPACLNAISRWGVQRNVVIHFFSIFSTGFRQHILKNENVDDFIKTQTSDDSSKTLLKSNNMSEGNAEFLSISILLPVNHCLNNRHPVKQSHHDPVNSLTICSNLTTGSLFTWRSIRIL